MDSSEIKTLKGVFSTEEGKKALDIIRRLSGYDTRTIFNSDPRKQSYDLGRASLFADISKILLTKKVKKNGPSTKSYIDE